MSHPDRRSLTRQLGRHLSRHVNHRPRRTFVSLDGKSWRRLRDNYPSGGEDNFNAWVMATWLGQWYTDEGSPWWQVENVWLEVGR